MAKLLKLRGGTTTEHSSFTGEERELTIDTTKDTAVVHDGTTAGGHPLQKELGTGDITSDLIADNNVTADELNVSGDGTSGQYLTSDGDGSMSWTTLTIDSEATTKDFTISSSGSATAGRVANILSTGETGEYPVVNTVSSESTTTDYNWNGYTPNYKYRIYIDKDSSNYHRISTYSVDDNTLVDTQTLGNSRTDHISPGIYYTGSINSNGEGIYFIGGVGYNNSNSTPYCINNSGYAPWGGYITSNSWLLIRGFRINHDTGAITDTGSEQTPDFGGNSQNNGYTVYGGRQPSKVISWGAGIGSIRTVNYNRRGIIGANSNGNCGDSGYGHNYGYGYYVDLSTGNTGTFSSDQTYYEDDVSFGNYDKVHLVPGITSTYADYTKNSSTISTMYHNTSTHKNTAKVTASLNTTYPTDSTAYSFGSLDTDLPDKHNDEGTSANIARRIVARAKDSLSNVALWTWEYDASGNLDIVANSRFQMYELDTSKSWGNLACSPRGGLTLFVENSRCYAQSFSLDSNYLVDGLGLPLEVIPRNISPEVYFKETNANGDDVFNLIWDEDGNAVVKTVTINAYSTQAMNPGGVFTESGTAGQDVQVATSGVVGGFTGLVPNTDYYLNTNLYDGTLTTSITGIYMGKAVSSTELLLAEMANKSS